MTDARELLEALRSRARYHRLRELGEGATATVHRAYDAHLGRVVACKELRRSHLHSPQVIRTFINEAKLIGYLDHPGVIPVFDTFLVEEDAPCYTMRDLDWRSLAALLDADPRTGDGRPLPLDRCLEIVVKLCETMAYAHDHGVIHLDLKPDHVMIGDYGEVVIVDWGAARLADPESYRAKLERFADGAALPDPGIEEEDLFIGTPKYMSPEQTREPRAQLVGASDVFSMGIIFYQALTGVHPFKAETLDELMERIRNHEVPAPVDVNPDVPARLSQICQRMLAKDRASRYSDFHSVLEDLAEFRNTGAGFPTRSCQPGEVLFRQGDAGEYACTILSGRVEISVDAKKGRQVLATLGPGEVFGELSLLAGIPRSATATVVAPTTVRIIHKEAIEAELDKLSPWVGEIVQALSRRFVKRSEKLAELEAD